MDYIVAAALVFLVAIVGTKELVTNVIHVPEPLTWIIPLFVFLLIVGIFARALWRFTS